jgi:4-diphosphocytidyl-2-C-methyl-D-erythritol kinase
VQLAAAAENDFEAPVFERYPMLRDIKQTLRAQGAELALLSGSGATVFGLFPDELAGRQAQKQFASDTSLNVFVVSTCSGPLAISSRSVG